MFPEISPLEDRFSIPTEHGTDVDSESDDGSDYGAGDTYLPLEDSDQTPDNNYDPTYMEEDGTYDDFLASITTIMESCKNNYALPSICTMEEVLVFATGSHGNLKQSWNVYKFVGGWIMIF